MQTAHNAVLDGTLQRLSDPELGLIYRRVDEIKRRINEGTLHKDMTLRALQLVIEGKVKEPEPCKRRHRSDTLNFNRPPIKERKKSKAPMRLRLPEFLNRLYYYYKYKLHTGSWGSPNGRHLHPEDIMAQMWEAENIPNYNVNYGQVPVQSILNIDIPTKREVAIVSSTLQWLATNTGNEFLVRYIRTADILV
jgi:hypothetical protein